MMQIKNKLYFLPLFLMSFLGLFLLININPVIAAPEKNDKGKKIASSEKQEKTTKKDISQYYELYNTLENYSEEDRNKIIQMLSDSQTLKILQEEALKSKKKGSSSKKPDDSKK
ncbi:MAG: SVM family protein [Sweet potato little leaf phytoplasma]|uniref:SVM family protein n=29 Tax=Candidatus Phytoplasma TaxID=33926 RepID=A0A9K3WR81_9MOLU|nr:MULTISPECIES: SVM family protein [Phytoplasma]ARE29776.1 AYWB SAP11-like protein [Crotalaria phyllody phytoplasma]ARE29781.1 AYWB SAP11-like protein [Lime witches'-broom phytoplasma]QNC43978.1 AYWB SAP11-like protein ['Ixeris chinensis' witches'-broom phytoplasma]QNC43979.1 AYWB SAP11-like protein ['Emilia sonchifolia' witches'-broom phytoplasma]QNC43980.1 AYWB SAP11-like protein ['Desmodium triflorum' little leaf phytoplasma]QRZ20973.1 AYWB SAP11-like protein [Mungbean phyllody phytoplasm